MMVAGVIIGGENDSLAMPRGRILRDSVVTNECGICILSILLLM